MIDRENVIKELTNLPTTIYSGMYQLRITHDLRNKVIALLKEQEAQRDYEASVEMAEYCERYEQTYNPEDGSM